MDSYNVEIGIALGEPGGTWVTVPLSVQLSNGEADTCEDVEELLLRKAREDALASLDERARDFVAYVWLHHFEWDENED